MPTDRPQPTFILIRPQMGENIGAAARAMWNFGLDRMRIIDPRDGWPNQKAVAMASGAGRLLDEAQVFADTPAAIADCDAVINAAAWTAVDKAEVTREAVGELVDYGLDRKSWLVFSAGIEHAEHVGRRAAGGARRSVDQVEVAD